MAEQSQKARCLNCRSDIEVPADFGSGDVIPCGTCHMSHKVQRDENGRFKRLIVADVGPLKEQLEQNRRLAASLHKELATARASLGLGANGLGLGVLYVVAQVRLEERTIDMSLLLTAAVIAVITGVLLEAANYLFLAKRNALTRLSSQLEDAEAEGRKLQQLVRDGERATKAARLA
jgi:hypothetical protein